MQERDPDGFERFHSLAAEEVPGEVVPGRDDLLDQCQMGDLDGLADLLEHTGRDPRRGRGKLAPSHGRHLEQSRQTRRDAQVSKAREQLVGGVIFEKKGHSHIIPFGRC